MEPNEVMTNEEVMETAMEEVTEENSGNGFKMAVGFGLGLLVGTAICKFTKPVIAKIKTRKEARTTKPNVVDGNAEFVDDEESEEKNPSE